MRHTASGFLQPQQIRRGRNSLNTKVCVTNYAIHLLIAGVHMTTLAFAEDTYISFEVQ